MDPFYAASSSPSSSRTSTGGGGAGGGGRRPSSSGDHSSSSTSSSTSGVITLDRLKEKGKKLASAHVQRELAVTGHSESLELLLDEFLSPIRPIADSDNIEWCKWLIAGGRTPGEFASIGEFQSFDMNMQHCLVSSVVDCLNFKRGLGG